MNNTALEINEICKDYPDFSLRNVSFSLSMGSIMGFVGQNGAGKTTTIRLILNMINPESGEIKIFGLDNVQDEQKIKQDIAVVFDDIYFVDSWNVREVEKALKGFYSNWSSKLFNQYVSDFHLPMDKKVKDLSRGMKMKLMLAVAMSHEAKLLILDEPTSGLDPVARDELLEILSKYIADNQKSILFSTHITSDLEKIADYITLIDHGEIFYSGTKDDLLKSFCIVRGERHDLTDSLKEKIIGLTTNLAGFAGLLPASEIKHLAPEIVTETPSIDEILVSISKGGRNHG
ncbi:ABC-type multidrug transport system, ATPase component [Desulfosporosinus orientis DSM 765]|uniref:ABC-type multidrug transport system, ATPase component n=1 Tax=Desulfosporosinus orientis (strain ATCC 19365 / DSM 765 / NCIMB 8382 / VKM B-1628 / Singapore I) TaxID=768706 RepID=G7W8P2_DESOD|nr:ABC transporter ATP-binding protein [Desulfosporosinus orientis]AET67469.1 ABC-type multidrug transport system, ATPase component [Desulfosporosinus orientis DSM 765]